VGNRPAENALPNLSATAELPWCPAHGHTFDVASPTKKPNVKVAADVKEAQTTEKTVRSDMVAEDMIYFHTAH